MSLTDCSHVQSKKKFYSHSFTNYSQQDSCAFLGNKTLAKDKTQKMSDSLSLSRTALLAAAHASRDRRDRGFWLDLDVPANADHSSSADSVQKIIVAAGVATLVLAAAKVYLNMHHIQQRRETAAASAVGPDSSPAIAAKTVPLLDASDGELTDDDVAGDARALCGEWDMLSPTDKHFTPETTVGVLTTTEGVFVSV